MCHKPMETENSECLIDFIALVVGLIVLTIRLTRLIAFQD